MRQLYRSDKNLCPSSFDSLPVLKRFDKFYSRRLYLHNTK